MVFSSSSGHDGVMAHEPTSTVPLPAVRVLLPEAMLAQASVVEHRERPGVVGLGSVVTVDETDNGAGARYRLVGSHEPQERGDVSISSPVGRALLGRRASETVTVSLPDGRTRRLRIVCVASPI
jgi:transcription elongation factor GreA